MPLEYRRARLAIAAFPLISSSFYGGGTQSQRLFRRDAETRTRNAGDLRKELFAQTSPELCSSIFAIKLRDETGADLCGTYRFALVSVGAIAERLRVHYVHHF